MRSRGSGRWATSKCEIAIVLDKPATTYGMGELVSGRVEVRADADVACKKLTLTLELRTHGRGNTATKTIDETVLFEGQWHAGQQEIYEFEIGAPPGPITYHGTLINVDWYLRARADIPWAIDAKAEQDFEVVPGAEPMEDYGSGCLPAASAPLAATSLAIAAQRRIGGVVLAAAMVLMFAVGMVRGAAGRATPTLCFASLVLVTVGGVIAVAARNKIASRKLGVVEGAVGGPVVPRGTALPVSLSFQPPGPIAIERITATLLAREAATSGSGTRRTTHHHTVHDETIELAPGRRVVAGETVAVDGSIPIPKDAACAFSLPSNTLTWELTLRIHVQGWPDWVKVYPIVVVP
ncbi:MAG: hypothetical protein U0166_11170 [Acidobacteriota bacterium]